MESSDSEAGGDGVGASPYQKGDAAARRVSPQAPAKPPTPGVTLVVRAGGGGGRRVRRTWAAVAARLPGGKRGSAAARRGSAPGKRGPSPTADDFVAGDASVASLISEFLDNTQVARGSNGGGNGGVLKATERLLQRLGMQGNCARW